MTIIYTYYIFILLGFLVYDFISSMVLIYFLLVFNSVGQCYMLGVFFRELLPVTVERNYRKMMRFTRICFFVMVCILLVSLGWIENFSSRCKAAKPYPYIFFTIMSMNVVLYIGHKFFKKKNYYIEESFIETEQIRPLMDLDPYG